MREYLIFHYAIDGVEYVEAYPIHGHWWDALGNLMSCDSPPTLYAFVSAPSRNQARKMAHGNWVTSKSWPHMTYRVYADAHTATEPGTKLDH